jgi:hypothetical protein
MSILARAGQIAALAERDRTLTRPWMRYEAPPPVVPGRTAHGTDLSSNEYPCVQSTSGDGVGTTELQATVRWNRRNGITADRPQPRTAREGWKGELVVTVFG